MKSQLRQNMHYFHENEEKLRIDVVFHYYFHCENIGRNKETLKLFMKSFIITIDKYITSPNIMLFQGAHTLFQSKLYSKEDFEQGKQEMLQNIVCSSWLVENLTSCTQKFKNMYGNFSIYIYIFREISSFFII